MVDYVFSICNATRFKIFQIDICYQLQFLVLEIV